MRKSLKRIFCIGSILVLALSFYGCQKTEEIEIVESTEEVVIETLAPYEEKTKVALIVRDRNGSHFEDALTEGFLKIESELSEFYELTIIEVGEDSEGYEAYLYQAADDKMDIIISFGTDNRENFEVIPTEYPYTYFILFDEEIDYSLADLSNVLTIVFDSSQASYLAGSAAALWQESESAFHSSGQLGFSGVTGEEGWGSYFGGFWQGVRYEDEQTKLAIITKPAETEIDEEEEAVDSIEIFVDNQLQNNFNSIFFITEESGEQFPVLKVIAKTMVPEAAEGDEEAVVVDGEAATESELQLFIAATIMKRPDNILYKILRDNLTEDGLAYGRTMRYGLAYNGVELQFSEEFLAGLSSEEQQSLESVLIGLQRGEIRQKSFAELTEEEQMEVLQVE